MILPWLRGILPWQLTHFTWALIAINCLIFFASLDEKNPRDVFSDGAAIVEVGQYYYQFTHPDQALPDSTLSENELLVLGANALRNSDFLKAAPTYAFRGDKVEVDLFRKQITDYVDGIHTRFSTRFGLSIEGDDWTNWLTYQFVHAGFLHLLGNMLMLVIFGCIIELRMGGAILAGVYVLGGLAGGLGFFLLSQKSLVPVVGASGSITALMAFYAITEKKRRVSFIYFLAPFQGFVGLIYLPTWMLYPLCFLPDIAGYLSTPTELGGGIAYSAHMGGVLAGLMLGAVWRFKFSQFEKRVDRAAIDKYLADDEAQIPEFF